MVNRKPACRTVMCLCIQNAAETSKYLEQSLHYRSPARKCCRGRQARSQRFCVLCYEIRRERAIAQNQKKSQKQPALRQEAACCIWRRGYKLYYNLCSFIFAIRIYMICFYEEIETSILGKILNYKYITIGSYVGEESLVSFNYF